MEKERVNDEQALKLQTLGFNEECMFYLGIKQQIPIPLKQQVFRWFREKYGLEYQIIKSANGNYSAVIHLNTQEYLDKISTLHHACVDEVVDCYSYEEVELACIDKLIEIVKNKKDEKRNT